MSLHDIGDTLLFSQAARAIIDDTAEVVIEKLRRDDVHNSVAYASLKRTFDLSSCSIAFIFLSPVLLVVAGAVRLDSSGPIIYQQERLGLNGKPFMLYKFRTMYNTAESDGAHWTEVGDPRITRVGRFLRATHLDELPQLWNVIRGDMSLVGPRPERGIFYPELEQRIHGFSQRLYVIPGITGLAQVSGGYDLSSEEKILYDIEYIKTRSIATDLKILLRTVGVVLSRGGAR